MSQKKKSYPEVKERLVIEIEKYIGTEFTAKKLSQLLKLPYTSVLLWLNLEESRPPSMELLIRLSKQFPHIDMNYIISGTITRHAGDNMVLITSEPREDYNTRSREGKDLLLKYTECLEMNAKLYAEIKSLKSRGI